MAVNPDLSSAPNSKYELKDQIALRNSTRCGTGTGTLAGVTLTVSTPTSSQKNNPDHPVRDRRRELERDVSDHVLLLEAADRPRPTVRPAVRR